TRVRDGDRDGGGRRRRQRGVALQPPRLDRSGRGGKPTAAPARGGAIGPCPLGHLDGVEPDGWTAWGAAGAAISDPPIQRLRDLAGGCVGRGGSRQPGQRSLSVGGGSPARGGRRPRFWVLPIVERLANRSVTRHPLLDVGGPVGRPGSNARARGCR